ncbi:BCD family MFS transporter [Sphingomonas sp.]|uniref:BCD family MFS transporter n=1 Tax=Sphingomonas sp. TaxID=28214 RepID=UPI001D6DD499|nr:BCD family MFS transporter [Sphingomonas sp.]MBX9796843.1 BCD family MFS transporter [Sphingomonas sp.]
MSTLGWPGIARLALVQSAIGAMVAMATSLLNRVMVVEYALPAALPAGLVAWHYAVQLSRPAWGHGSDRGARRTPWIVGGMAVLYAGLMCAVAALAWFGMRGVEGMGLAIAGFTLIGAGVGAAGTSLLALLATRVAPARRASAAAITWVMMILGIVVAAGVAGRLLDPFTPLRLAQVVAGVGAAAFLAALIGVWRVEQAPADAPVAAQANGIGAPGFAEALAAMLAEPVARQFTIFVFLSMLAYSMQDLILEPFAGLYFGYTAGQSTSLSSVQHGGVLLGMILAGVGGSAFGGGTPQAMRRWIVGGCLGSALALLGLSLAARIGSGWPLALNVWLLGFANGVFAVAAIGAMMGLAGAAGPQREGMRMGVWGAAQAVAFGLGGLSGAVAVDLLRGLTGLAAGAFSIVFVFEGGLFLAAAWLAAGMGRSPRSREVPA